MKQKMVVKVSLNGNDSRCKAMKIAVSKHCGIESIEWKGENQLEVVGDGIDVAKLTDLLRKKVGRTEVVSVNPVHGGGGGGGGGGSGSGGGDGGGSGNIGSNNPYLYPYPYPYPYITYGNVVPATYYELQPDSCNIL
ncbi:hypothetical protein Ancab_010761 [Ancistrocladus abbreviatus]